MPIAAFGTRIASRRHAGSRKGVDAPADERERSMHLLVDRVERRHVEEAAADARLVRGDDDRKPAWLRRAIASRLPGIGRHSSAT
jgi:hypothetical protein